MPEREERLKDLWGFYTDASARLGAVKDPFSERETAEGPDEAAGETESPWYDQSAYTMWHHFEEIAARGRAERFETCLSPLARRFLGDETAELNVETVEPGWEYFLEGEAYRAPNENQRRAVEMAIREPVSLLQGPPGTGKTTAILNLLSCLLHRSDPEHPMTIAVVSNNHSALDNIQEELKPGRNEGERWDALRRAYIRLGKRAEREKLKAKDLNGDDENGLWRDREDGSGPFAAQSHQIKGSAWMVDSRAGHDRRLILAKIGGRYGEDGAYDYVSLARSDHVSSRECARRGKPIVISTINSLRACFSDGATHLYDYIIMDEASQSSLLAGLLALNHAKHLVLVGDMFQLPAVLRDEKAKELNMGLPEWLEEGTVYPFDPNESFFTAALTIFGKPERLGYLAEHYRCHPAIIGFSNDVIYKQAPRWDPHLRALAAARKEGENEAGMEGWDRYKPIVASPMPLLPQSTWETYSPAYYEDFYGQKFQAPIKVLWYLGGYANKEGHSWYNGRQQELFFRYEWPDLLEKLKRSPKLSFAVISPYKAQLRQLGERLKPIMKRDLGSKAPQLVISTDENEETESATLYELCTAHKSQGKGFDIVYLMPVDDRGLTPNGMSQQLNLVNVMVSRAKKELRIITGLNLMSHRLRNALLGLEEGPGPDPVGSGLFFTMLLDYVMDTHPDGAEESDGPFGFHRGGGDSVFDICIWERNRRKEWLARENVQRQIEALSVRPNARTTNDEDRMLNRLIQAYGVSTPESVMAQYLSRMEDDSVILCQGVPLTWLIPEADAATRREAANRHLDFVLLDKETGRLLAAIEVDGSYHWTRDQVQSNDEVKDCIIQDLGGTVLYGNALTDARDHSVRGEAALPGAIRDTSFPLLRLPYDGSSWGEVEDTAAGNAAEDRFTIEELVSCAREHCDPARAITLDIVPILELAEEAGFPVAEHQDRWNFFQGMSRVREETGRRYRVIQPWIPLVDGVRIEWLPCGGDKWDSSGLLPLLYGKEDWWRTAQPGCSRAFWESSLRDKLREA